MIYSPETKHGVKLNSVNIIYIDYDLPSSEEKMAHSVGANPSSSRPICPFFLVLVHVVSAQA
jgi:hypothetical protein